MNSIYFTFNPKLDLFFYHDGKSLSMGLIVFLQIVYKSNLHRAEFIRITRTPSVSNENAESY